MRRFTPILTAVFLAGCAAPAAQPVATAAESETVTYAGDLPCADCPAADLFETYWRAVEIDGEPVPLGPGQREPHLVLSGEGNRVHGFSGCNRLAGEFVDGSDGFRFRALAGTRMACPGPAGELETRFLRALEATAQRRIVGDSLELRDEPGALRMRLEATRMR